MSTEKITKINSNPMMRADAAPAKVTAVLTAPKGVAVVKDEEADTK